jgi:hypothetical protein
MTTKQKRPWLVCFTLLLLQGCAGIGFHDQEHVNYRDESALFFFAELDRLTDLHCVQDRSKIPVDGFPYLRTDRFLEALKERLQGSEQEDTWIQRLQQMDLELRRKEIANLPQAAIETLVDFSASAAHSDAVFQQAVWHSNRLLADDRLDPRFIEKVRNAVFVPDEYSTLWRWIGLYPLAAIPVAIATASSHNRYKKWHETGPGELPVRGSIEGFAPPPMNFGAETGALEQLFEPNNRDAFGLPKLNQDHERMLAQIFAPVILQDVGAPYDRFGKVSWQRNRVFIDTGSPAVYFYLSHSFFDGKPVLQVNFSLWYTERAGDGTPWIERGPLDGLTYRVTLNQNGEAVMIDVMNSCGCYHFFVPKKERIQKIMTKPGVLEPLIPAWMPNDFPKKPIQLQISSGWHQAQKVTTAESSLNYGEYKLIPYDTLESLPKEDGRHESVFDTDGIMKDSWRIEPYIFFSMGIAKVGYMRQRGRHAVKMVGREHFTNPHLFDRNFMFNNNE